MIYAMSDLHGCYELYLKMLDKIGFSDSDTLYLLGDYVDRGERGLDIILDIAGRKNVVPLMGNHDFYAFSVLSELRDNPEAIHSPILQTKMTRWFANGGYETYDQFNCLNEQKRNYILSVMDSFLNYADIEVLGRRFTMVHGGIANYDPEMSLDNYGFTELAMVREDYTVPKFNEPGRYLVTGHTPTAYIDHSSKGRIYRNHDHIAIDCGAVFNLGLGCICLDTLEEFYVI